MFLAGNRRTAGMELRTGAASGRLRYYGVQEGKCLTRGGDPGTSPKQSRENSHVHILGSNSLRANVGSKKPQPSWMPAAKPNKSPDGLGLVLVLSLSAFGTRITRWGGERYLFS